MKTILHTIDTTGPGGAETVFVDLLTQLPKDDYRPVVLIHGKGWVYDELRRRGVEPFIMSAGGSFNWSYLIGLMSLIRREKVDLIQSHLMGSNVYCSLAGMLTRKPVLSVFHGAVDISPNSRFQGMKFGAVNMGSRYLVFVSRSLRDDIVTRTTLRKSKARVIYNGVRTRDFALPHTTKLREEFGWLDSDIIIGCLGNIRAAKGYDVLLRAIDVLKHAPRFKFVIAGHGKGQLLQELLDLRSRLGLEERVHFLGFNDDPAGFLASLDMFLLPSTSEGFSIETIQARAAGLPVIPTRSGGPEELQTHGETGWMIEPGSAQAMADAIQTVSADNNLQQRLANNGRVHAAKTFDLDKMLVAYQMLYEKLL